MKVVLSIGHSVFVKGDHANFEIDPSVGLEASQLYPDVKYTTVDEYLDEFVWELKKIPPCWFHLVNKLVTLVISGVRWHLVSLKALVRQHMH